MKTPFSWKLTACACAVLLAACGGGSAPKDLPIGVNVSSLSTNTATNTPTADAAATGTTDSASTSDNANSTTDNANGSGTSDNATSGNNAGTADTGSATDSTAATENETIVKYADTPFGKNMTFDNGFQWGGVATQQPHLRDTKHVTSGGQLDKVSIDGREIMLFKATHTPRLNVITGGKAELDEATGKILYEDAIIQSTRGGLSYTWFGIVNHPREDINRADKVTEHIDTMIAHGKLTDKADMPTSGSAKYNGHAIYYTNGVPSFPAIDDINAIIHPDPNKKLGTTQFDVDYGNKTISGSIKDDAKKAADIMLEGKIDGNSFEGSKAQNFNGKDVNVEMKGRFFGPVAAELGGVFNSRENDDILGAFGAKKVK